jgi:hypothetical protein
MREPMGTCPCPAGPPLEKLSNGPPGTRRTPVNTALAWIRGYMDLHAFVSLEMRHQVGGDLVPRSWGFCLEKIKQHLPTGPIGEGKPTGPL